MLNWHVLVEVGGVSADMSKETIVSISFDPSTIETCALVVDVPTVAGFGFLMTKSSLAGTGMGPRGVRGAAETKLEARARKVETEKMPFMMFFVFDNSEVRGEDFLVMLTAVSLVFIEIVQAKQKQIAAKNRMKAAWDRRRHKSLRLLFPEPISASGGGKY